MPRFPKLEWKTVLAAVAIVSLCILLSFSPFMPLIVLAGHVAAALYLLVGSALSLRSANELAMPQLQFAGRILHAQCFYALAIVLSAGGLFLIIQALLTLLRVVQATRWAMLVAFGSALSTPIVLAVFSRFLLSRIAGWDRLKYALKGYRSLLVLPGAIVVLSAILALALSLIIDAAITWTQQDLFRWLGLIVIWGGVGFLFSRTDFQARKAKLGNLGSKPTSKPLDTEKILLVGADGGDWHVIMPLVEAGRMPNLRALMDSGSYGYLDTFGRMHSPVIWTTIATGASADRHGITGFFTHDPQKPEKRRLFEIQDRQVPAIWNVLNKMGRRVGVINWLLAYAPERVDGYMISRMREPAVYPEAFEELLTELLSQSEGSEPALDMSEITTDMGQFRLVKSPEEAIKDLRRIRAVAPRFMREFPADLTMVYEDATDGVQHTTWQYREPQRFDPKAWNYDAEDIQRYGNAIDEAWEEFDELLGVLSRELGSDGTVMVVSDHGFRPRESPSVYLDMNALLRDMGYLEFKDDGSVDFSQTAVYWSTREITSSCTELSVNGDRKRTLGSAKPSNLGGDVQQVAADLMRLRINGEKPLFDYATPQRVNGATSISVGLTYETMKMGRGRVVEIGKEGRELDRYLKVVPDGSGRHDPFGIFIFSGPGIRNEQVVAAGALHTVLNDLLGHVRGLSQNPVLGIVFQMLDRFGLINPYTTNDVAPTLLYLADCPIPDHAVGSLMARSLSRDLKGSRAVTYVEGLRYERDGTSGEYSEDAEQQVIERLRALGYVD